MRASQHIDHHANRSIDTSQFEQGLDGGSAGTVERCLRRFWRFLVNRPLV